MTHQSFKNFLELIDKLIKSCSKYHDYLESDLAAMSEYQSLYEPNYIETSRTAAFRWSFRWNK